MIVRTDVLVSSDSRWTVAIPTFNGAAHLSEALQSVLAQTDVETRVVVCDDASSDGTLEVARDAGGDRIELVANEVRAGLAGNWNRCLSRARTPYLAILHQDDRWHSEHLRAHDAAFRANPRIGMVASASIPIDEKGARVSPRRVEPGGLGTADRLFEAGELINALTTHNPLRCSAVSLRMDAARAVGAFSESLKYVTDWDYWIRIACAWAVQWLATPTVEFRWHSASETQRFRGGVDDLEEQAALLDRLFRDEASRIEHSAKRRRVADRRLSRAFLNRAYTLSKAGNTGLAKYSLLRSLRLNPAILATIAADPRLLLRITALALWKKKGDGTNY